MKSQLAILVLSSTVMMTMGQTRNFFGCSASGNSYCTNGQCYAGNIMRPANLMCSKDFKKDVNNLAYPVTYDFASNPTVITWLEKFNMVP